MPMLLRDRCPPSRHPGKISPFAQAAIRRIDPMLMSRSRLTDSGDECLLSRTLVVAAIVLLIPLSIPAVLSAQTDWPVYGHDTGATRYSPLQQINTKNVSRLRL